MAKNGEKSSAGTVKGETGTLPNVVLEAQTIDVPVSSVEVVPGWNMRKVTLDEKVRDLAESIRVNGQLQECVVTPKRSDDGTIIPGAYLLVAGERRYVAIKEVLQSATIRVRVLPTRTVASMWAENADREAPTPADTCRLIKRLRDDKLANGAVAAMLRITAAQCSSFYSTITKLAPDVWAEWSARSDEDGAVRWAFENYARSHDEQRTAWAAWKEKRAAGAPTTGKAKSTNKSGSSSGESSSEDNGTVGMKRADIVALAHRLRLAVDAGTDHDSTCETWLEALKYILTSRESAGSNVVSHCIALAESKRTKMGATGAFRDTELDRYLTGKDLAPAADSSARDAAQEADNAEADGTAQA